MKQNIHKAQAGYAMLLTVLALMGIGGVVLAGFTQSARQELDLQRYQHNQRVLEQAKQALLMFAYNYPETNVNGIGPGRLPCPDVDNDGTVDGPGTCNRVGRFPWADDRLAIQETLDASGERLWYAVSDAFDNIAGGGIINSDTAGSITLVDQSGNILYDGAVAGLAAVIIAPGPILDRDQDGNGSYEYTQVRDTGVQKVLPRNYLDTFDGFDNAVFTNGESDSNDDGFILGPVYDSAQGRVVVNDQLVIVTAREVLAMAEKATLHAYRESINRYLANVGCVGETPDGIATDQQSCVDNGGSWNPVYPWLYNYRDVVAVAELADFYPARDPFELDPDLDPGTDDGYLDNYGRIPSTFAEYFTVTDSQPIESELIGTLQVDYTGLTVSSTASGNQQFNDGEHTLIFPISGILPDVRFLDDLGAPNGRLAATVVGPQTFKQELYFWDLDHGTTGFWTVCPAGGDELSDCHRDSASIPVPGGDNDLRLEILRVELQIVIPNGPVTFDANYTTAPTIAVTSTADGNSHATIAGTFAASNMDFGPATAPVITATYQIDRHYHEEDDDLPGGEGFIIEETGDLSVSALRDSTTLTLEMRYYPELPGWACSNHPDHCPDGNGWHDAIRMAYADIYRPDIAGVCNPVVDGIPANDCLFLPDERGVPRNIASLLVIAAEHDWQDDNVNAPVIAGMEDELRDVFDDGNQNNNRSFSSVRGNDEILVIEEL